MNKITVKISPYVFKNKIVWKLEHEKPIKLFEITCEDLIKYLKCKYQDLQM